MEAAQKFIDGYPSVNTKLVIKRELMKKYPQARDLVTGSRQQVFPTDDFYDIKRRVEKLPLQKYRDFFIDLLMSGSSTSIAPL